jgi:DNA-directed RNA polymerase specialized sigma24 family protein
MSSSAEPTQTVPRGVERSRDEVLKPEEFASSDSADAGALRWSDVELHSRVIAGDSDALQQLLRWATGALRGRLSRIRRLDIGQDPQVIDEAIDDTLLRYVRTPCRYDPHRGSLLGWLSRCAANRARDISRSERRRQRRYVIVATHIATHATPLLETANNSDDGTVDWSIYREQLLTFARTPTERAFLVARLDGQPLEVQAQILGIRASDKSDQRRQLRRVWDLVRRRIRWRTRGAAPGAREHN